MKTVLRVIEGIFAVFGALIAFCTIATGVMCGWKDFFKECNFAAELLIMDRNLRNMEKAEDLTKES